MSTSDRAVLLARTNSGTAAINEQVRALTRFAADNHIHVVGKLILPHCAEADFEVEKHLTALLGRRRGRTGDDFNMIIIADLSRLSRRGVPSAMALIKRLAAAGVSVVTPDLGVINEMLWQSFPLMRKGWARWRRNRSVVTPPGKKELNPNASKTNSVPRDDEDADARGDGLVHGRAPRPHRRDGPPKPYREERR